MPFFFAAASVWAAIAVPLWLAARAGVAAGCGLCATAPGHAASLLGGYALAVVAGFLVHRPPPLINAVLVGSWILARLPGLLDLPTGLAVVIMLPFPMLLLAQTVPRFVKAAKGGHNRIFAPILVTLVSLVTLLEAAAMLERDLLPGLPQVAVLGIALLLFAMGGRIIPAATAGALRAKGRHLEARVQRPLEWAGLGALALGASALLLGCHSLAGASMLLAALATVVRLARWRGLELMDRGDIWGLHLGYAWLGLGLLLAGLEAFGWLPVTIGVHAIMVGGLGTLAATMMVRTVRQRARRPLLFGWPEVLVLLALSTAAALRIAASSLASESLLVSAGLVWSAAHLLLLICLLQPRQARSLRSAIATTGHR